VDTNILRKDRPEVPAEGAPHACYRGVVYLGRLVEDDSGEEVEIVEAVPCRRCSTDVSH